MKVFLLIITILAAIKLALISADVHKKGPK
jgi:hypothetical protein